jgi:hypothetical protein
MSGTVQGNYRYYRGQCAGHSESVANDAHKRVAISFTSDQIEAINRVAEKRRTSFSKAVSDLVGTALGGEGE